jgi:predicted nucleic acid-binding protein
MIVVLDTNTIMDALQERQPFNVAAQEIFLRAQNNEFECCFTASSVTDIFYLYSKARDLASARRAIGFLLATYRIIPVTHDECTRALSIPVNDYENALLVVCSMKAEADFIISRDKQILESELPIKVIEPQDFLQILTKKQIS